MLDCGDNVSFITIPKCKSLDIIKYIKPAGQLTQQADGKTRLHVKSEISLVLTRNTVKNDILVFIFNALVVEKLNNCDVIRGQNFLIENHIDIYPRKRKIAVREKYFALCSKLLLF